jgi:HSP20 family protein
MKTNKDKIEKKWLETEGELAVDVYSIGKELVIQSAIAGVKPEDINVSAEDDVIIIKGERKDPSEDKEKNYFFQECYWGKFSRKIIVPDEIDPSRIDAVVKAGILTIRIPLIIKEKNTIQPKKA